MASPVDPRLCPLCGASNACGILAGDKSCWCTSAAIPSEVLAAIPDAARDKACLCERCAKGERRTSKDGRSGEHVVTLGRRD